jgi:hypothetical protein
MPMKNSLMGREFIAAKAKGVMATMSNIPQSIVFPILTTDRYLTAVDNAAALVRERLQARATGSRYPKWFTRSVIAGLLLVMGSSFFISSGKQIAAFGMVFDDLPNKFNHLSSGWAGFSIVFMLLMSEAGAVLFLVASGTIGESAPPVIILGRRVNFTKIAFRLFALLCASYAIASNITITALDPVQKVSFIQWMASIGIPLTVLGLSMLLERIVIDAIGADNDRKALVADPTLHEAYKSILYDCLWTELNRYKAQRGLLESMVETDSRYKRWIISGEYAAHQDAEDMLSIEASNPFLAAPPQALQP